MTLRVITPTSETLAELDLVKQQIEFEGVDRDALIESQLATALSRLEGVVQRRYLTQTLELSLPCWPCPLRLPVAPVAEDGVDSIIYVDAAGAEQTLDAAAYVVSPAGETVCLRPTFGSVWPILGEDAAAAVRIRFTAGQSAETLAAQSPHVITAALMTVGWLFGNRGDADSVTLGPAGLPEAVESLILLDHWT